MLEQDVLAASKRRIDLKTIDAAGYPEDVNFICPMCNYVGKFNKTGTAKIFSKTKTFKCFACGEFRRVK